MDTFLRQRAGRRAVLVPAVLVLAVLAALAAALTAPASLGDAAAGPAGPRAPDIRTAPEVDRGAQPSSSDELRGLTPGTRRAFAAARAAAARAGRELGLTSGYRTREEQERLYREALETYGSVEEAQRWVLPPDQSQHVRGVALDVRPRSGAEWLEEHGARFGLCRTYAWEWWHFEYRAQWHRARSCPAPQERD